MTALLQATSKMYKLVPVFLLILLSCFQSKAQVPPASTPPTSTDTLKLVEIIYADRNGFKKVDSVTEYQMLVGKVIVKQENTWFYCDSAVYNKNLRIIEAFGNVHINDNDSVHTYAQYLLYHVDTRIALLKKKVRLTDSRSSLFTEELTYDINQKIGEYKNGGRVVNGESVLTSKEGTYYADMKDVYFKKNVELKDPKYKLKSDSLLYNTETEIATFISMTHIEDSAKRKIRTKEGFYDLKNRKAYFSKRPVIEDGAVMITAENIETDDQTGYNKLKGNAVYKDTAQGIAVLANLIEANRNEGNFRATLHPLMIIKQENDSLYITADTLFSGRLSSLKSAFDSTKASNDSVTALKDTLKGTVVVDSKTKSKDSTDRYFQAYRNVRIFSDSLQAVSDSMFYSGKDSIFQLFNNPIVWATDNQVTGDTIYLYTKNKKADRLFVFENGLLINKAGPQMYNQIRGNRLNGYFIDGNIDRMRARGNAESIYYIKDDNQSLVGVNKATGDIIELRFLNKELNKVVFISEVKGRMFPLSQFPPTERELRGFKWHDERRPKTKFELFEY